MKTRTRIAVLLAAGVAVAAAAPAMASTQSATATKTITVTTPKTKPMAFTGMPKTLKAGTYKFVYKNDSGILHNLKVGNTATPDFKSGSKTITVTLKKGEVKYLCTITGHAQMGMEGEITVK